MYPPGHVGIALALYAPVGLLLLVRGRPRLALAGTAVVAAATMLPDVDSSHPWFVHRGRTHTVWFALAVGVALGAVATGAGRRRGRHDGPALLYGAFGFFVGALAVLAHLLGDVITPMGVRPLYPLSETSYTFSLVFASDPAANARLFALGCFATIAQVLLGVGLAPRSARRPTLGGSLRVFARDVLYGAPDAAYPPPGSPDPPNLSADPGPHGGETDD